MLIDFHVHAFADSIAEKAVKLLSETSQTKPETNGTLMDTKKKLKDFKIDKAVILPIATKPSQQTVINNWAYENQDDFFCFFGSIHPDSENVFDELKRIKNLGLHGIKLHPDYQDFMIDEDKMIPIYKKCVELDLPVLFHAGLDPFSPNIIHAPPELILKAFNKVPEMTMILGHLGGMSMWDEVEKYLVGKKGNIFFDISVVSNYININQAKRIIKNHGSERILFGSDCPWDNPINEKNMIENMNLSQNDMDLIFYKNAQKMLLFSH